MATYVGVPESHKAHGSGYDDERLSEIEVHGGLTFSEMCADTGDESIGVCHVAECGRPDHVWWLGFDCAHSGDVSPATLARVGHYGGWGESYKSLNYVRKEVESLADQLAKMV